MPRSRLEELAGYNVDVDGHMDRLLPRLAADGLSLAEFAAGQHEHWTDVVEKHQSGHHDVTLLSILHARLKFVGEGTDPEPEATVAYFARELGDVILSHGFRSSDGEP